MMNDKENEVIKELFDTLENRHQNILESMKDSEFVFDYVHSLYYKCPKENTNRDGSYLDSPDWIKPEKVAINHTNKKYNQCFQYTVTVGLNHEEIKLNHEEIIKDLQKITKIKSFINKCN